MRVHRFVFFSAVASFCLFGVGSVCFPDPPGESFVIPGLMDDVRVVFDQRGTPHIMGEDFRDVARVQGYIHARDRFFQMDLTRREVDGTRAEVLGDGALGGDIQNRTIGLQRAAQRSLDALTITELELLQVYSEGVNSYLATNPLPPEYDQLFLTVAREWTPYDVLLIGKGIAASLSLDIDIFPTLDLNEYIEAGENADPPFDGEALYFDDVARLAPMDPASTVPDAIGTNPYLEASRQPVDRILLAKSMEPARRYLDMIRGPGMMARKLDRADTPVGSNEWGVSAAHSATGFPMIANDPHLSLDTPSTFYENRIDAKTSEFGPVNAHGMSFPGTPGVILGQNPHITWGATTNPLDVADVFNEKVVALGQPGCTDQPETTEDGKQILGCIITGGQGYPVILEDSPQFFVNRSTAENPDNLEKETVSITEGGLTLTVPFRSHGPILSITDPFVLFGLGTETNAFVLQYTGFHATREVQTFLTWDRATNMEEFLEGVQSFDFGAQNWAYADKEGNLAYFSSAEVPLRTDLEQGFVHDGQPPWLVRDGESGLHNWIPDPTPDPDQAVPFEILPYAEMPQMINPPYFANANNDPAGMSLDNDPLNQRRTSNPDAIYYIGQEWAMGMRAGRITQLLEDKIMAGEKISVDDMRGFQSNNQQRDAELMMPHLLVAWENAQKPAAAAEFADFTGDAGIVEAMGRLADWDFSTPTGIPEGWDRHDSGGVRAPVIFSAEAAASVAATLYNVWRGQLIRNTIDATLAEHDLSTGSSDALKGVHHLLTRMPFTGVGESGLNFFPDPEGLTAEERRDVTLLQALRDTLDLLAGPNFANAFGNSTNQDDYRWGRLHRIVFDHPLEGAFEIPPAAGFNHLSEELPGIPRDGGYNVVNASGFGARSNHENGFMFGGGPVRRYVGVGGAGADPNQRTVGFNVYPGGTTADPDSPFYAVQLDNWLTADHFPVIMNEVDALRGAVKTELFQPPE